MALAMERPRAATLRQAVSHSPWSRQVAACALTPATAVRSWMLRRRRALHRGARTGPDPLAQPAPRWHFHLRRPELPGPLTEPAKHNAIHDLVRWVRWSAAGKADDRVTMTHVLLPQSGWPFMLQLRIDYDFRAERLIGAAVLDTGYLQLDRDEDGLAWVTLSEDATGTAVGLWMDRAHQHVMSSPGTACPIRPGAHRTRRGADLRSQRPADRRWAADSPAR
jgi:hypothetical protein